MANRLKMAAADSIYTLLEQGYPDEKTAGPEAPGGEWIKTRAWTRRSPG